MSVRKVVPIEKAEWHVAPVPSWVVAREPDWSDLPAESHPVTFALLDEQHHSATHACTRRSIRRLVTFAAVQSLGQVEVDFDPAADRLLIHELAIWRQSPAGVWEKRSLAQRDTFLLRQREQQLEQQMLNGRLSVVALLEDVRVGDAIELCWTTEPLDRLPGLHFTAFYAFAWGVPVACVSFAVHRDPAVPLTWRMHLPEGATAPVETVTPELVTWTVERPPIFKPEPNVPGGHWAFPLLDISGWTSWTQVADFVAALWADALADGAESIAAEAARIRAAHPDDDAAIRAAIRFAQEEIRYLAVDFGHGGGMLPNGAGTILRRRFGDCKDKSVLLTALLRALGVEAWPLLVGSGWRGAVARVQPSPSAFSHAIVTFFIGEKRVFLDPTFLGQGGEVADFIPPPYGCGLEVRSGVAGLITIPPPPPASLSLTETFHLDRKSLEGSVHQVLRATGWLADDLRGALVRQGAAAFLQARVEALQRQFPAAVASPTPAIVVDPPRENSIEWSATHALPTWGASGQKPPPMFRYGAHGLFLAIDVIDGPEQRLQPWELRHPISVHHRVIVRGRCVTKTKPERHRVSGPGFRYSCDVTASRREVIFDYRWETTQGEIAPGEWRKYCEEREKAFQHAGANVATQSVSPWLSARLWIPLAVAVGVVGGVLKNDRNRGDQGARLPASTAERQAIDRDVSRAYEAMQKGDFASALPLLRRSAPYFKNHADFQTVYAEALLNNGHLGEIPALLAQARKLKPDSLLPDLIEGGLLEKRGELTLARAQFQKVLAQTPDDLRALHGIGRTSELLGDRPTARQAWERFLVVQPANPEVLGRYALLLWSQGEKSRADEMITGVIKAQPVTGPLLQSALATYFQQTGRAAEAVEPARRAAELAPNDPQFILSYVLALVSAGDAPAALTFAQGKLADLKHPLVWRAVAIAASTAGRPDEAEPAFREWLKLTPRDPEAHASYGFFLHQSGRTTEARSTLERAVRDFPGHGLLWLNYSVVLEAQRDPGAAPARQRAETLMSTTARQSVVR